MMKDDWIAAALVDDSVVVEMLFRLKQSPDACAPPEAAAKTTTTKRCSYPSLPPLRWGNRRLRSKPPSASSVQKWFGGGGTATRRSPTTPLSWSGGSASPSDGGCDESVRPPLFSDLSSLFRSMCTVENEICNISSSSQRSKRKKTFSELKEEENSLLKERVHLEKELASMNVTLKQQRARSKNLKKIKFDLNLEHTYDDKLMKSTEMHSVLPKLTTHDEPPSIDSCRDEKEIVSQKKNGFILPDLNMEPSEEEMWN